MSFYKEGMRIEPHPDVPDVLGIVVRADDDTFDVRWDDGDEDLRIPQCNSEDEDLRVHHSAADDFMKLVANLTSIKFQE